jgi:hypothetical protein
MLYPPDLAPRRSIPHIWYQSWARQLFRGWGRRRRKKGKEERKKKRKREREE